MTFSDNIVEDPNSPPENIIVWDVRTGKKKRSFQRGNAEDWPIIKYIYVQHDDSCTHCTV